MEEEFSFSKVKLPKDPVKKANTLWGAAFAVYGAIMLGMTLATNHNSYDAGKEDGKRVEIELQRSEAISKGYAQYDAVTGKFRWKTPAEALISIMEKGGLPRRPAPEPKIETNKHPQILADEPQLTIPTEVDKDKKKGKKS